MTTLIAPATPPSDLAADNLVRLAIFNTVHTALADGASTVSEDDLFKAINGRLQVLVPQELHNHPGGDRGYFDDKIDICIDAGILICRDGELALAAEPRVWIRYPGEKIEAYTPGLIPARERLDEVNRSLRAGGFNVVDHLPHHDRSSSEYQALVQSMRDHGFLREGAVFFYPDGTYVDGVARIAAAADAGIDVRPLTVPTNDPESTRRRRHTPLDRVLWALALNATRITQDDHQNVLDRVADAADRPWADIDQDLQITQPWRAAAGRSFTSVFEVKEIPVRDEGPTVIVTTSHKFHMTRLLGAFGMQKHKKDELDAHMFFDDGRYVGGGPSGKFGDAVELVGGINEMLKTKKKPDARWIALREWLQAYVDKHHLN